MSGGALEYVMGHIKNSYGSSGLTSSVLSGKSNFIDVYTNSSGVYTNYNGRILGDGTAEIRNWYSDMAYFVYSSSVFFTRGGNYSYTTYAGLFAFNKYTGGANSGYGFRLVLKG